MSGVRQRTVGIVLSTTGLLIGALAIVLGVDTISPEDAWALIPLGLGTLCLSASVVAFVGRDKGLPRALYVYTMTVFGLAILCTCAFAPVMAYLMLAFKIDSPRDRLVFMLSLAGCALGLVGLVAFLWTASRSRGEEQPDPDEYEDTAGANDA